MAGTISSSDAFAVLAGEFTALARAMSEHDPDGLHAGRVVQFAAHAIPGAEHAGVTIIRNGGQPRTLFATGELPQRVDDLQYEFGEGPCLQALTQSDVVWSTDLSTDRQWPNFAPRAVELTGVRSMLSFRLFLTGNQRGALNFYATSPRALGEQVVSLGAVFASYASLTLLNEVHRDQVMNLERALESNREIGVAIGILMAREPCTQSQAFDKLRSASQRLHRKLRDIAEQVKRTGELPRLPAATEDRRHPGGGT
jgi:hypothetical protein